MWWLTNLPSNCPLLECGQQRSMDNVYPSIRSSGLLPARLCDSWCFIGDRWKPQPWHCLFAPWLGVPNKETMFPDLWGTLLLCRRDWHLLLSPSSDIAETTSPLSGLGWKSTRQGSSLFSCIGAWAGQGKEHAYFMTKRYCVREISNEIWWMEKPCRMPPWGPELSWR